MSSTLPAGLQKAHARSPITYSKVLLVEGMTPFQFFKALLQHIGLLNEIEIRNFGGVTDFSVYLEALIATPGFGNVISLGIIRDAEDDANNAFASVCNSLRRVGLDVPPSPLSITAGKPKVSVFILPDCAAPGMIETLCMQAVSGDPAIPCISQYLECLEQEAIAAPHPLAKAQVQAFLASRERPGLQLGEAAHAGYLPWDNTTFDPLKQFLHTL
jgi:hypothetical protein